MYIICAYIIHIKISKTIEIRMHILLNETKLAKSIQKMHWDEHRKIPTYSQAKKVKQKHNRVCVLMYICVKF